MTPLYIPPALWHAKGLTLLGRILLAEVARDPNATVSGLVVTLGVKEAHICRTLRELDAMRFIVEDEGLIRLTELGAQFWLPDCVPFDDHNNRKNCDDARLLTDVVDVPSTLKTHLQPDQREAGRRSHSGEENWHASRDTVPQSNTHRMLEDTDAVKPAGDDEGTPGTKARHPGPQTGPARQQWAQEAHRPRDKDPPASLKGCRVVGATKEIVAGLQGGYTLPAALFDLLPAEVVLATHRGEPCIPMKADKTPLVRWKPYQERLPRPEEFRRWVYQFRDQIAGWARVTGRISNLIVLDDDGGGWLEKWELSPHVRTKRGGCHWIGEYPGWRVATLNCKTSRELGEAFPNLDIRGDGGYSMICNGEGSYEWLREPVADPLDLLPSHVRKFFGLEAPPKPRRRAESQSVSLPMGGGDRPAADYLVRRAVEVARSRGRNTGAMWLAGQLRDNGYSEGEAEAAGRVYLRDVPDTDTHGKVDPYTEEELLAAIRWNFQQPRREPWPRRS